MNFVCEFIKLPCGCPVPAVNISVFCLFVVDCIVHNLKKLVNAICHENFMFHFDKETIGVHRAIGIIGQ